MPQKLKKTEKQACETFQSVTGSNQETAINCLQRHGWRSDRAVYVKSCSHALLLLAAHIYSFQYSFPG